MNSHTHLGAALLVLALGIIGVARADMVVLESINSTEYAPGNTISAGTELALPSGASLTLIGSDGTKTMIIGPYTGVPEPASSAENPSMVRSLSELFSNSAFVEQLAALRSVMFRGTHSSRVPPPWVLDPSRGGDQCVPGRSTPMFWRADTDTDATLSLNLDRQQVSLNWPRGQDRIGWPLDIKLRDGSQYRVAVSNGKEVPLTLHLMPDDLPTRAHQADWMTKHRCERQAVLLLVTAKIDKFIDELADEGKF